MLLRVVGVCLGRGSGVHAGRSLAVYFLFFIFLVKFFMHTTHTIIFYFFFLISNLDESYAYPRRVGGVNPSRTQSVPPE